MNNNPMEKMGMPMPKREIDAEIKEGLIDHERTFEQNDVEQERKITVTSIEKIGEAFDGPYMITFCKEVASGKSFEEANKVAQMAAAEYGLAQYYAHKDNFTPNSDAMVYNDLILIYKSRSGSTYTIIKNNDSFSLHYYVKEYNNEYSNRFLEKLDEINEEK
jgi:hypothetical protein